MLMQLKDLNQTYIKGGVTGVIHAGAHDGEEYEDYRDCFGAVPITWIEGDPDVANRLLIKMGSDPNVRTLSAVLADEVGKQVTFHRANNEQSSSILEFGTHLVVHPEVEYIDSFQAITMTLDSLPLLEGNFLNMDLQGAEGMAIAGANELMQSIDFVYTEVNRDELYLGLTPVSTLRDVISGYGLKQVEIEIYDNLGWGDAFFVRESLL